MAFVPKPMTSNTKANGHYGKADFIYIAKDLKRRLVVGHKSDGRSVYDEAAKSELVALCRQPDVR